MYELEDYEEELSAFDKKDDVYRVEKVLKRTEVRGKKMVLVKWLGYAIASTTCGSQRVTFKI